MGEFELIEAFLKAMGRSARKFARVGPGDDCAVLPPVRGELCVTTDALVEGVHFSRPAFSLEDVGYKALAVNLSDLAAMGAEPRWFVCAIAAPALSAREVQALAKGLSTLAEKHQVALVGGNFSRANSLSITLTAAGEVPVGKALLRSGAKPKDKLYVSGELGLSAKALEEHRTGRWKPAKPDRQRRPQPKIHLGLLARNFASAAIDISDGFAQDLGHLCAQSGVGAKVDLLRLPAERGEEGLSRALCGGEDYELILTVPPRRAPAFERACQRAGEKVSLVGEVVRGKQICDLWGTPLPTARGHDHFGSAPPKERVNRRPISR